MPEKKGRFSQRLIFLRLSFALILIFLLSKEQTMLAAFFFAVAAGLGVIEGIIQKRLAEVTQRRKILDFTADKVLVNAVAFTLAFREQIPLWVPLVFLARDIISMIGAAIILKRNQEAELKHTTTGKMALFFQVVALLPAILGYADLKLIIIAVVATIISAIEAFAKSEFRPLRKKPDIVQFSMVRMLKIPDLLTMGNAICGLLTIMFAINHRYGLAAAMMLASVVFDFFDGRVARWLKQQHEFGKELDSLADTVAFGVAPAIFAFSLIQTKLAVIAFTIFVFCGILRLARYNVIADKSEGFMGMPITLNGIIIPLIYFAGVDPKWFPYIFLILGFLMVSSLKVRKL